MGLEFFGTTFRDTFQSLLSGLGVYGRDKVMSLRPSLEDDITNNKKTLEALYRGEWLARKIVDIPAFDSTRAWRDWNAKPNEIEALEATERSFGIQKKVLEALIKARLYGGSAIIMGIKGAPFNEELDLDSIDKGDLKFVHVVEKWMIQAGPRVRDITSPWFGEPNFYMRSNIPIIPAPGGVTPLETSSLGYSPGETIWIHPSRVVRLVGIEYPDIESAPDAWGDSVLQPLYTAIRDAGLVTQSLANMISDTKVDVVRIPGLTATLQTNEGTQKMLNYLSNANVAKSTINSLVLDKEIEWERIQTKLEGLPEVLQAYLLICAAGADIPTTRLLAQEPTGMNATGDSDIRNYYDRLSSDQKVRLTPLLNRMDEVLIRHTFGKRDKDIKYTWSSLWQMNDTEKADIALKKAQAYKIDVDCALIPAEALMKGRENQLLEDDTYPGLDDALDELDDGYEDDHMDMVRHIPLTPEEMMEKKAQLGGPSNGSGGSGNGADKSPKQPTESAFSDDEQSALGFMVSGGVARRRRSKRPFGAKRPIGGPASNTNPDVNYGPNDWPSRPWIPMLGPRTLQQRQAEQNYSYGLDEHDGYDPDEPRDDHGRWGTGSSGMPAHIKALRIPPAWKNVRYAMDPNSSLLVTGKDAKGRCQAIYSAAHTAKAAAAKFARIEELNNKFDGMLKQNSGLQKSSDAKVKEAADCTRLIMTTGIRPGSRQDTGAEKQAYGATTLEGRHVIVKGGKVTLKFTGKKGVDLVIPVDDKATADMLIARKAGSRDPIFDLDEKDVRDHVGVLDGGSFLTKDLRTLLGTRTAMTEVAKASVPHNMKEYKKAVKAVATKVSEKLGNTPTIALQSYINPVVFADWKIAVK